MRFYQVQDHNGATHGCELTLKAAKELGMRDAPEGFEVWLLVVDGRNLRDALRREFGKLGGNCELSEVVYTYPPEAAP